MQFIARFYIKMSNLCPKNLLKWPKSTKSQFGFFAWLLSNRYVTPPSFFNLCQWNFQNLCIIGFSLYDFWFGPEKIGGQNPKIHSGLLEFGRIFFFHLNISWRILKNLGVVANWIKSDRVEERWFSYLAGTRQTQGRQKAGTRKTISKKYLTKIVEN